MNVLIVYGSTEGHTRDLCCFAADRLREAGRQVTLEEARADLAVPDPAPFDRIILAASLHAGRFQPALIDYARAHHDTLNAKPAAFISVSLSAAGENPHDWEGLSQCLEKMRSETQWTPTRIHNAAGAIRYSRYDFFKRLALQYIAAKRGQRTVTSRDYDLTDYEALKGFVLEFVADATNVTNQEPPPP